MTLKEVVDAYLSRQRSLGRTVGAARHKNDIRGSGDNATHQADLDGPAPRRNWFAEYPYLPRQV